MRDVNFCMMRLARAIYELFESDMATLQGAEEQHSHEIDRELRLEFTDCSDLYIAWCSHPTQYAVGYQEKRWNVTDPEHIVDVSQWKIWRELIGQEISFVFHSPANQVLELRGDRSSVYCSSQERGSWQADVLHLSLEKPEFRS